MSRRGDETRPTTEKGSGMSTSAQRAANRRYSHKTKPILLRINPRRDGDIYRKLSSVDNMSGYIKGLIRQDIRNHTPMYTDSGRE